MEFVIDWDSALIDFYKYGSTLEYESWGVHFENEILSPGAVLASWSSHVNYGQVRSPLQLPLLKKGFTYQLRFEGEFFPADSLMFNILYFDRVGKEIGRQSLSSKGGDFTYLEDAYAYSIRMISVGLKQLNFRELLVCSIEKGG